MSLENARAVYPIMVQLARDLSQAAKERRPVVWVSYDDLCVRCKEVGVKETPRTIATKLLKPLQAACLEKGLPDLERPDHLQAQAPGRLRQPPPPHRRLVGALRRQEHGRRWRRRLLVQGVPERPRLRRLARRGPLLTEGRPMATASRPIDRSPRDPDAGPGELPDRWRSGTTDPRSSATSWS